MFQQRQANILAFAFNMQSIKSGFCLLLILMLLMPTANALPDVKNRSACEQLPNPGICRGKQLRYAYDPKTKNCISFYYTGCGATENNFLTFEECRRDCMSKMRY